MCSANTSENLQPKKLFKTPKKPVGKFKRKNDNCTIEKAYHVMKSLTAGKQKKDEYSIFGDHVRNKIRKLPTNYAKNT